MSLTQDDKEHKVHLLLHEPKAMAKQRLMDFAASLRGTDYENGDRSYPEVSYSELIERATNFQEDGDYWSEGPRFDGQNIYDGFWDDYALVTQLPVHDTYGFFSCSC